MSEATAEEIAEEFEERNSENPAGYEENFMPYKMNTKEIKTKLIKTNKKKK